LLCVWVGVVVFCVVGVLVGGGGEEEGGGGGGGGEMRERERE